MYKTELLILAFFSILGYVQYIPYFTSNLIFFIIPLFFFINFVFLKITPNVNQSLYFTLWIFSGLFPYLISTTISDMLTSPLIIILRLSSPLLIYHIAKNIKLSYPEISKMLILIYILNFVVIIIQYFYLPEVRLVQFGSEINWFVIGNSDIISRRVNGLLGNANALSAFALILYLFVEEFLRDKKWQKIFFASAATTIIFFAKSRNVILVSVFILFYNALKSKKITKIIFVFLLAVAFSVILYLYMYSNIIDSIFRFSSFDKLDNSYSIRTIVNLQAINIWLNNFIIFGGGALSETYYMAKFWALRNYSEMLYTKILIEQGIFGLILFSMPFFFIYTKNKKNIFKRYILNRLYLSVILISFMESVFYQQQLLLFLFLLFGLINNPNFLFFYSNKYE